MEGINFTTYYHSVAKTIKELGPAFHVLEIQELASVSPPPYMENFPARFPHRGGISCSSEGINGD